MNIHGNSTTFTFIRKFVVVFRDVVGVGLKWSISQNQKGSGFICATRGKKWSDIGPRPQNQNFVNPPMVFGHWVPLFFVKKQKKSKSRAFTHRALKRGSIESQLCIYLFARNPEILGLSWAEIGLQASIKTHTRP